MSSPKKTKYQNGASITEAVAGLVILVPIALLLVDTAALVITQTANDSLAKNAARQAASQSTSGQRQAQASAVVTAYKGSTLCSNPHIIAYSEPNGQTVQVTTQMTCILPVQVPFGGPASANFAAFATEPIVSALQTANTGSAAPATGGKDWGQQDDLGYLTVKLQTGPGGDPTQIGPLIPYDGAAPSGGGSNSSSSSSSSGSSNSGSGSTGTGGSGKIGIGPVKGGTGSSGSSSSGSSSTGSSSSGSSSTGSSSTGSSSTGSSSTGSSSTESSSTGSSSTGSSSTGG